MRTRTRRIPAFAPLTAARPGLGPLETRLLELLWEQQDALTVQQVRLSVPQLAYTTLMTTLDRMFRKGVLTRSRRGRAFAYQPRCSRFALIEEMVSGQINDLLAAPGAGTAVLSTLINTVSRRDVTLLDELDALVQAERARLGLEDK